MSKVVDIIAALYTMIDPDVVYEIVSFYIILFKKNSFY